MKTILFCNSKEPQCGVYQYGNNLCTTLVTSREFEYLYFEPESFEHLLAACVLNEPNAVMFNWHPDMGGYVKDAPFEELTKRGIKQVLVYHDWEPNTVKFDGVLFSDPTMKDHTNWHVIPRPLPLYQYGQPTGVKQEGEPPIIGVHGFFGASSDLVVARVMQDFESAKIRLHLPFAHFGDREGKTAMELKAKCIQMLKPGFALDISHDWKSNDELLDWLAQNDLNCYLRDTTAVWRGVSSALDAALAVRRPIAVNKCQGFRHFFDCEPSVCVEDRSLKEILSSGLKPLEKLYAANAPEKLVANVDEIMRGIIDGKPGFA